MANSSASASQLTPVRVIRQIKATRQPHTLSERASNNPSIKAGHISTSSAFDGI